MIRVDLKKELEDSREKSINQANSNDLKEIKLLLEQNTAEEKMVLKEAGLYGNIQKHEALIGVDIQRKKLEEGFGVGNVKVFTAEEVRALCVKYNLRFLSSKMYKGYIEPTLGAKIVRFFKEGNIHSMNWEASTRLFIMAPIKAFNLQERPEPPKNVDPALFYRIETSEGIMYALIHKWGRDFTAVRRIGGIFRYDWKSWFTFKVSLIFLAINLLNVVLNPAGITPVSLLTTALVSFVVTVIQTAIVAPNSSLVEYDRRFNKEAWNSIYKK